MSITPIPILGGAPYPFRPYSNITPFTVRDGTTFLEVFEALRTYIKDVLVPSVDTEIQGLDNSWHAQVDGIFADTVAALAAQNIVLTDAIAGQNMVVNDAVASIINSTIAVSDPVMLGVINAKGAFFAAAENYFQSEVTSKAFGAVGDGVTDDTAALQAGIDYAFTKNLPLKIAAGTFIISSQLLVKSKSEIGGVRGATVLKQVTPGQAVIASFNYVSGNGSPSGQLTVKDLFLSAEPTSATSHGLIIRDYYSKLENLVFANAGGNGLHMTHLDSLGANPVGGTLVDNRIIDCEARGNKGYGVYLGATDNNKITDGMVRGLYVSCGVGAPAAIYCGSSAGWKFSDIHTYGSPTDVAIDIVNPYLTGLNELYMEGGSVSCVRLSRVQKSVTITNLQVRGSIAAGGAAVDIVSKASFIPTIPSVIIESLAISQDNNNAFTAVRSATSSVAVYVGRISADGAYANMVTEIGGGGVSAITYVGNAVKKSTLGNTLSVADVPLALSNRVQWSGGAAQTLTMKMPPVAAFAVVHGTIAIVGVNNYNGSIAARWRADLTVTGKAATDPNTVYTADIIAATGFVVPPVVTVDRVAQTMTVTFTATSATAYGVASVIIEHN